MFLVPGVCCGAVLTSCRDQEEMSERRDDLCGQCGVYHYCIEEGNNIPDMTNKMLPSPVPGATALGLPSLLHWHYWHGLSIPSLKLPGAHLFPPMWVPSFGMPAGDC